MRVVGAVCLIGTNGVQEWRFLFSVIWGVKTWETCVEGGGAGGAPLGRAPGWSGRAGRPSAMPPPAFGCGAVGWADWSVGPIVVLCPAEGSDFLSVGGFGQSEE